MRPKRRLSLSNSMGSANDRNSLSASPKGRPAAASIFSGKGGVKEGLSSASRLLGTATMTLSAVMAPPAVSTRNLRPLRSIISTGWPSMTGKPVPLAAIAVHHPPVAAAVVVATDVPRRDPIELRPVRVRADRIDQGVPLAARLEKRRGRNVRLLLGAGMKLLVEFLQRLQKAGLLRERK